MDFLAKLILVSVALLSIPVNVVVLAYFLNPGLFGRKKRALRRWLRRKGWIGSGE